MKHVFQKIRREPLVAAALALIGLTSFLYYTLFSHGPSDTMVVAFLDVGQGDAIFIEAPNGAQMLIDGGNGSQVLRELGNVMPFWDRTIDVVVATHPDQDHIGGLIEVIRRYRVGGLVHSGSESESELDELLFDTAQERGTVTKELRTGDSVRLSPRVHFDVLFPPVDPSGMDPNDGSLVGRLVYGETAFLLSGDAPRSVEEYVAGRYTSSLESNVLKVGHHGSDTSSAAVWVGWSSPEYAVISAGKDNRYGHPHKEVVDLIERFDVEMFETAKDGTIVFESDGKNVQFLK